MGLSRNLTVADAYQTVFKTYSQIKVIRVIAVSEFDPEIFESDQIISQNLNKFTEMVIRIRITF